MDEGYLDEELNKLPDKNYKVSLNSNNGQNLPKVKKSWASQPQ